MRKTKKMGDTSIFFSFVMVAYLTYTRVGTGELVCLYGFVESLG